MSSTPRAKPTAKPEAPSPRAAKPAAVKAKKKKAPSAPMEPVTKIDPEGLGEKEAKGEFLALQQKYGTLVVGFNDQQAELAAAQEEISRLEKKIERLESAASAGGNAAPDSEYIEKLTADLRASEAANMTLQKKVNKLQVEHVSEEEVDQLFYALEVKEQQLENISLEKQALEAEVLTARQLSARGAGTTPQIVEIHHHNDLSDDEEDAAPAVAVA